VHSIRVLIADDHPVVRRGMSALLSSLEGVEVVAEVGNGEDAVREAQLLRPDVVVMDVQMPGVSGIEATRRLTTAVPGTAVLVVTMFEDDETVFSALQVGARGYLLKGAEQEDILTALRSVVAGQLVVGPRIAQRFIEHLTDPERASGAEPLPVLTGREREVLERLARGQDNATIAAGLGLAAKTVGNHISAIFAKLHVTSRAEAVARARESGLGGVR
jgi:DNA-binding NarL/FixJ family response regulator